MQKRHDIYELKVVLINMTEKAYLITATGDHKDKQWVPKSQVELSDDHDEAGWRTLELPEWLAEEKGFL